MLNSTEHEIGHAHNVKCQHPEVSIADRSRIKGTKDGFLRVVQFILPVIMLPSKA